MRATSFCEHSGLAGTGPVPLQTEPFLHQGHVEPRSQSSRLFNEVLSCVHLLLPHTCQNLAVLPAKPNTQLLQGENAQTHTRRRLACFGYDSPRLLSDAHPCQAPLHLSQMECCFLRHLANATNHSPVWVREGVLTSAGKRLGFWCWLDHRELGESGQARSQARKRTAGLHLPEPQLCLMNNNRQQRDLKTGFGVRPSRSTVQ